MELNAEFWNTIKSNLKSRNENNKLLETWFDPVEFLGVDNTTLVPKLQLGVPTKLHKYWIVENFIDKICAEISAIFRHGFDLDFIVTGAPVQASFDNQASLEEVMSTHDQTQKPAHKPFESPVKRDVLNQEYTFSTFVVGRNNEFAHAASYNVAMKPGTGGYNPLFICGPVGMGKTHLLNAVGNQIREGSPNARITYVSAERFLNECIASIRRHEMDKFRLRYREKCDVLLVDDVQMLGRGQAVQEEFFHTLNDFFEKNHQVVVASDRMPKDIYGLEDRIRSRLEWGLIADIQMPDIETRVAILRYKSERLSLRLSEDVVNYIAKLSKRSIRELEGNLKKVKMFSELQGLSPDLELTRKVLSSHDSPTTVTIEEILKLVADHYKIKITDLKSSTRARPVVVPRQMAMSLIKKHLDKSLMDIGRAFGGKDHTTVINALNRIESLQAKDLEIKKDYDELNGRIHNITGV